MDKEINEFENNIMENYSDDINNIFNLKDYMIFETFEECITMIKDTFTEGGEILLSEKKGKFTILANEQFLLIAKKEELVKIFKIIYKFLLNIKNNFNNELIIKYISNNVKMILSLIDLVLLFNDNITFYSLKKKILLSQKVNEDIYLSEYNFTHLLNKNNRKSAISWDYKYFLVQNFKEKIYTKENIDIKNSKLLNIISEEIEVIKIDKEIFFDNTLLFIMEDLLLVNDINLLNSRNYHMWTYLRKIYNEGNNEEKILILLYSFNVLKKCNFDYSAFSFIINSRKNIPLTKIQIDLLIKNIEKSNIFKYDDHKCYINELNKYF